MNAPELTPEQMERAMMANRLQLAGFPDAAAPIVERLKAETQGRNPDGTYGRFRINEADECALEHVESPRPRGSWHSLPLGIGRES